MHRNQSKLRHSGVLRLFHGVISHQFDLCYFCTDSWPRERRTPAADITAMTSSDHVTSPIDSTWPLSYRLPIVNNPLSPVVSKTTYQTPPRYTPQPRAGNALRFATLPLQAPNDTCEKYRRYRYR